MVSEAANSARAAIEEECAALRRKAAAGGTLRDQTASDLCRLLPLKEQRHFHGHRMRVLGTAWHPDSTHLVSIDQTGMTIVWDTVAASPSGYIRRKLCTSVAVAPVTNGDLEKTIVAIGGLDNSLSICNIPTSSGSQSEVTATLPKTGATHDGLISSLAFLDTGTVVSAGGDGDLRIWDVGKGETAQVLRGHTRDARCVAVGAGGGRAPRIASCSLDGTVRLWDPRSGGATHTFECGHETNAVCHYAAGDVVAAGSDDGVVRLFDARSYATLAELSATTKPAAAPITGVQSSVSGRALFTAHDDASLGVWDPLGDDAGRTHRLVVHRTLNKETLTGLALSADGAALAVGGFDTSVRVFTQKPEKAK